MKIRILIADDHRIIRDGLSVLIEKESNMAVIATAENGRKTLQLAQKLEPDIIIMDISMPELNGIDATKQIKSVVPKSKIIALSMHSDKRFVSEMLQAGASGYLLKDCAFEELAGAINAVYNNQTYLSPKITGVIVDDYISHISAKEPVCPDVLSPREREVLQLIAEGKSTKTIASHLKVSVKTIETHRHNIKEKLHTQSLAELTKYAIRHGITPLE
jgi:DNA-binding NarL/FixJ family response regulator